MIARVRFGPLPSNAGDATIRRAAFDESSRSKSLCPAAVKPSVRLRCVYFDGWLRQAVCIGTSILKKLSDDMRSPVPRCGLRSLESPRHFAGGERRDAIGKHDLFELCVMRRMVVVYLGTRRRLKFRRVPSLPVGKTAVGSSRIKVRIAVKEFQNFDTLLNADEAIINWAGSQINVRP